MCICLYVQEVHVSHPISWLKKHAPFPQPNGKEKRKSLLARVLGSWNGRRWNGMGRFFKIVRLPAPTLMLLTLMGLRGG